MKLEIEFSLQHDMVILTTPYSNAEFSDTESGRAMLFRALRHAAQYAAGRRVEMGATDAGRDAANAVAAYDLKNPPKVRKFDERNKPVLNLDDLELEL